MTDSQRTTEADGSWASNRMLWLVIAIPALTVAGCLLTVYLAVSNPDRIVSEYKLSTDTGVLVRDRD